MSLYEVRSHTSLFSGNDNALFAVSVSSVE
jgi:hypothetical protein